MGKKGEFGFDTEISKKSKIKDDKINNMVMSALREQFKPEFLNRIDDIIIFHSLDTKQIRQIVNLQIVAVEKRLKKQKIHIKVSDKAKDWLAKKGFDENLGARPLKRVIQTELLDKLAMLIVEKKITEGKEIKVEVVQGELKII